MNSELRVNEGESFNEASEVRTDYLNQIKSNHFCCHITTAQVPW